MENICCILLLVLHPLSEHNIKSIELHVSHMTICACGVSGWDELATALAADFQNTVSCSCNSNRAFHSYVMISWTAGHLFLASPWFAVLKSKWQRTRLGRDQPSQGRKNFNRWVLDDWFPNMGSTSEVTCKYIAKRHGCCYTAKASDFDTFEIKLASLGVKR